ncbi:MAG: hypothetical protein AAF757_15345 [Cyanobacteria bacterium P01_D01_bin.116]
MGLIPRQPTVEELGWGLNPHPNSSLQPFAFSLFFMSVEYIIHLLRLRLLHHQNADINIQQVQEKLENYFKFNQLQTPEQIHADN